MLWSGVVHGTNSREEKLGKFCCTFLERCDASTMLHVLHFIACLNILTVSSHSNRNFAVILGEFNLGMTRIHHRGMRGSCSTREIERTTWIWCYWYMDRAQRIISPFYFFSLTFCPTCLDWTFKCHVWLNFTNVLGIDWFHYCYKCCFIIFINSIY